MQVENIQQNQTNFKGTIYKSFIIDKSRANALKAIHNDVSKMLKDKPYDLYIEENYGPQTLTFSLKNSKPKNKFFALNLEMKSVINDYAKLPVKEKLTVMYRRTVNDLIGNYEKTQSFIDSFLLPQIKIKNWFNKLGKKFGKKVPNNNEV